MVAVTTVAIARLCVAIMSSDAKDMKKAADEVTRLDSTDEAIDDACDAMRNTVIATEVSFSCTFPTIKSPTRSPA